MICVKIVRKIQIPLPLTQLQAATAPKCWVTDAPATYRQLGETRSKKLVNIRKQLRTQSSFCQERFWWNNIFWYAGN